MDSFYHAAFLSLNASDDAPRIVVAIATLVAKYVYFIVPLHMGLVWFGGTRVMRFVALSGVLAVAMALIASGLTGLAMPTDRPLVIGLGRTLIEHRPSSAFPSNHAIVCFAWAATLAIYGRAALAYAIAVIGVAVAWSRVYLGIHYPVDMIGAGAFSGFTAIAAAGIMTIAGNRVMVVGDRLRAAFGPAIGILPGWIARKSGWGAAR